MIKVACIGAGYFSQFHLNGWRRNPQVELVGVCDSDQTRAEAKGAPAFTDLVSMLKVTDADIIDVILPPDQHTGIVTQAIAHAPKAIICQKPFCRTRDEARALTQMAADAGIPLIIHENFRFQPWYRTIRQQIETGSIGTPLQASFRLRPGDGQGPCAYLARQPYFRTMERFLIRETGVHFIDVFRFLFGPIKSVFADLRTLNPAIKGEDAGHILFEHETGARSLFDGNRLVDHAAENTRCTMGEGLFEGTGGTLSLTGDGAVTLRAHGETAQVQILAADTSDQFGGNCAAALQDHVVDALTKDSPFENTARDYLTVLDVEDAIYTSAKLGQKIEIGAYQ